MHRKAIYHQELMGMTNMLKWRGVRQTRNATQGTPSNHVFKNTLIYLFLMPRERGTTNAQNGIPVRKFRRHEYDECLNGVPVHNYLVVQLN